MPGEEMNEYDSLRERALPYLENGLAAWHEICKEACEIAQMFPDDYRMLDCINDVVNEIVEYDPNDNSREKIGNLAYPYVVRGYAQNPLSEFWNDDGSVNWDKSIEKWFEMSGHSEVNKKEEVINES